MPGAGRPSSKELVRQIAGLVVIPRGVACGKVRSGVLFPCGVEGGGVMPGAGRPSSKSGADVSFCFFFNGLLFLGLGVRDGVFAGVFVAGPFFFLGKGSSFSFSMYQCSLSTFFVAASSPAMV